MMSRLVLWMIVVALGKLVTSCARNGMMAMKPRNNAPPQVILNTTRIR